MPHLPALTARQVIRILKKFGFREDRQKGSHLVLFNPLTKKRTVIPIHPGRTIKGPLLKAIIEKDAAITIDEFLRKA